MSISQPKSDLSWSSAFRIGSLSYPATLFLVLLSAFAALAFLPMMAFVFGSGGFMPVFVLSWCIFWLLIPFKQLIFSGIYKNTNNGSNAALIEYLVQQNVSGVPGEEEVEMELIENALHLKQVRAAECMAPRAEIVHLDIKSSVESLRQLFIESRLSRIIITQGDLDRVLGYVHVQQMFSMPKNIRPILMPITFVPENIAVNDLLNKFVKNRTNIACVVNEYGSVSGLVTLENVLEQLFGKIDDEHDDD
jgi:CBS domain containing-hemolysin-like protein